MPVAVRSWSTQPVDKTIVLLHGATSSSRTWWQVAPDLSRRGYHIIAPDLPGHGKTPAGRGSVTPTTMAERVLGIIASRPIDLLLGHSLGSIVAIEMLHMEPNVSKVLILDEPPGLHTVQWRSSAEQHRKEQTIARETPELRADEIHRAIPAWHLEDCAIAVEDLGSCDLDAVTASLTAIASGRSHEFAATIDAPTLLMLGPENTDGKYVVGGAYGSSIQGKERAEFVRMIRNSKTSVFGVGHVLHRDAPLQWVECVAQFAEHACT
jgi:pimeloyl-ACP methyl ester carboxylesterase